MLIYSAVMAAAALAAWLARPREPVNRWAAIFLLTAASGGMTGLLERQGLPGLAELTTLFNACFTPYAVLVFTLIYGGFLNTRRQKALLQLLLLLPPTASALGAWLSSSLHAPQYSLMLIWAAPYYLASCGCLILSLRRERHAPSRRGRLVMTAIMVPTLLGVLAFINVGKALRPEYDFFRVVSIFMLYSMGAAVVGLFLYGVLGIRLRVERDPVESAMETAGMGASMLSHSLKNEIGKISIGTDLLRRELKGGAAGLGHGHESAAFRERGWEQLDLISRSADRMLETVQTLHGHTREISWEEQECRLDELLDKAVGRCREAARLKGVELHREEAAELSPVICDPFHMEEALVNVISNAIEATPPGGRISACLRRQRRGVAVIVQDNGSGIDARHLPYLFMPFYSTKQGSSNFGIGLSYVYRTMKLAGGKLDILSDGSTGTTVELRLPASKRKGKKGE